MTEVTPRDRIVAAAEAVFADKGVHGTSLREIARIAETNVNLIGYYFTNKDDLFDAVVDARSTELNRSRQKMLEELEERYMPGAPPVEDIIRSLLKPFFEFLQQDRVGWSRWVLVCAREAGTEMWNRARTRDVGPVLRRFYFALHRALPLAKQADILFIIELSMRAMSMVVEVDSRGIVATSDPKEWSHEIFEERVVTSITAAALNFAGAT